jgi:hypothetical protein
MGNVRFEGKFQNGRSETMVNLTLFIWEEDKLHYVFSPALDLYGYGKDDAEAKASFEFNLLEFVNYTENKKTIFDELERLGWTTNRKKNRIKAPEITDLMIDNVDLRALISNPNVRQENTYVELALT